MKNVIVERVIHDGENRIAIKFPYDTELIALVKGFPGARWSNKMKCWHVPVNPVMVSIIEEALKDKAILHFSDPKPRGHLIQAPTREIDDKKFSTAGIFKSETGRY